MVTVFDHLSNWAGNHTGCINVLEASDLCGLAYHKKKKKSMIVTLLTTTRGTRTCFLGVFSKISKGLPSQCQTCLYHTPAKT